MSCGVKCHSRATHAVCRMVTGSHKKTRYESRETFWCLPKQQAGSHSVFATAVPCDRVGVLRAMCNKERAATKPRMLLA